MRYFPWQLMHRNVFELWNEEEEEDCRHFLSCQGKLFLVPRAGCFFFYESCCKTIDKTIFTLFQFAKTKTGKGQFHVRYLGTKRPYLCRQRQPVFICCWFFRKYNCTPSMLILCILAFVSLFLLVSTFTWPSFCLPSATNDTVPPNTGVHSWQSFPPQKWCKA
jgi:hypothetical protein